jgi:hypothetical protein
MAHFLDNQKVFTFPASYKKTGKHKKKLRGFSLQANYTDRATAASQQS